MFDLESPCKRRQLENDKLEKIGSAEIQTKLEKNESSFRTWAPAFIAIFGVIIINALLLGPTGGNIPSLTERQFHTRRLAAERTQSVSKIEFDHTKDIKNSKIVMFTCVYQHCCLHF